MAEFVSGLERRCPKCYRDRGDLCADPKTGKRVELHKQRLKVVQDDGSGRMVGKMPKFKCRKVISTAFEQGKRR